MSGGPSFVAQLANVTLQYGNVRAVDDLSLRIPANRMVGLIGPDGVGKSSLLSLISGTRKIQVGEIEVLGGNIGSKQQRTEIGPRIAYMPQGLGKNLYPTLSVFENVDFFGRLFGQSRSERQRRIDDLLESTGLAPFRDRPAGKLSGGMKQKVGLCCALIHDPELLILDEPTTGVDPLSRRQFWQLIERIRGDQQAMSVIVATAYMDEAEQFDWLVAMDEGKILATGSPKEIRDSTGTDTLESAFIALLPAEKLQGHREVTAPPRQASDMVAIEAQELTKRFGNFTAVDHVNFRIERGEIFGFLGSNGCGKTTTMKMLTGLLPATEGRTWLFGQEVDANDLETRKRVGYMSQSFSLYSELTVRQNFELHARLFHIDKEVMPGRIERMAERFDLTEVMNVLPGTLPLGQRQRLSLAVAMVHHPEMLILDEPTSGVDPVARDGFWQHLIDLSRRDNVTIFISTHFMNEAMRCDRISLMHAGKVLASDTPHAITESRGADTLEEAFIGYLEDAAADSPELMDVPAEIRPQIGTQSAPSSQQPARWFDPRRMFSYARREALELRRDPIRLALAGIGSVLLMFIMGYGITMDIENLTFAVLDRDQSTVSRDYILNLAGSRYFVEKPPIVSYKDLDARMRAGDITLAIEIPPNFARDIARRRPVQIGVWLDGAMPSRAETIRGYVVGMHTHWLNYKATESLGLRQQPLATIETRFRYNPDVKSIVAMVPAVIPLLLLLIPAMLASLAVVREKELGSILNFYATPVTQLEFLLGKQLPYVVLAMGNFLLLVALAVWIFGVPVTGSFATLFLGALLYVFAATAMGLLISTFMRSQIAAIFGTAVLTMLPASSFSGIIDPVSSLEGAGAFIGQIYPTTHFLTISRGTFSKALGFADLGHAFVPLAIAGPVLLVVAAALLRKQET